MSFDGRTVGKSGMPLPISAPYTREGHAWNKKDLDAYLKSHSYIKTALISRNNTADLTRPDHGVASMGDINAELEKTTETVEASFTRYREAIKSFGATMKNDLSSLGAASNRVHGESIKVVKAMNEAIAIWQSEEMAKAIENAERLAIALEKIQSLQNAQLSFAVINKSVSSG